MRTPHSAETENINGTPTPQASQLPDSLLKVESLSGTIFDTTNFSIVAAEAKGLIYPAVDLSDPEAMILRVRKLNEELQARLTESEGKFRVLFDVASDAIFIAHFGLIVDCNARGLELMGLPREQIIGQSIIFSPPSTQANGRDVEEEARECLRHAEAGVPQSFEWLLTCRDGRQIHTDISFNRFEQGGKFYVQAVARDISERKRAEEVLRRISARAAGHTRWKVLRDVGWIVILSALVFFAGDFSGLSDEAFNYIQSHDTGAGTYWDESVVTLIFLCFALCVFSYRRWRESRTEAGWQSNIAEAMGILRNEMEAQVRQRTSEIINANKALETEAAERKLVDEDRDMLVRLIQQSQDFIAMADLEGKITFMNRGARAMIGLKDSQDPASIHLTDYVPEKWQSFLRDTVLATARERGTWEGEMQLRNLQNGKIMDVFRTIFLIRDSAGEPKFFATVTRDITKRKQKEQQIVEQAALLDKAQDAIVVADLESKIQFWNKGAERMYGWSKEEALGKKITELIAAAPELIDKIMPALLEKDEFSNEVEHLTKDGRRLTIEARRTLIRNDDGIPKSLLAIYTDVTEKKKIEAQFMRAQRMESIGTLAGGIAHDLNNILAPIMMSIDILKLSATDPDAKVILKTIDASARRGADIVRQVLSFARGLEGARIEVQPQHLVKEFENIIKDTFPKDIRLQFSIPNHLWTILGDPTQVHQILLNLCVNARDAMPNGGTLAIGVENRVLDEQYAAMNLEANAGRYVSINVTDSGTGIPPDVRDKIFDPFFTTKEVNKGTGLGLSTVLAIVKSHHGFIEVRSEVGKGATFAVCLPAMEFSPEGRKSQPEETRLPRGSGETVLVVDDEASILAITSQTLKTFGYRVLTATDGADAVAVYAQHANEVTIVLTDMNMPIMDGPAMIGALVRMNPKLKIIGASGLNARSSMTNTSEIQVKYFLMKPYTAATLLKTLRKVLDET